MPPTACAPGVMNAATLAVLVGGSLFIATSHRAVAQDATSPKVTFAVGSHWTGGYGGSVRIQNRGASAVSNWALEYQGGPSVGSLWNGVHALLAGGRSRITNAGWNGTIPAGGSVEVGFNGIGTMTNDVSDCRLNGALSEVAYDLPSGWTSGGGSGGGGGPLPPIQGPTVKFVVSGSWQGGYNASISITNHDGSPIAGWVLEFQGGPSIGSLWNGTYTSANGTRRIADAGWNSTINAGGSVSVGFTGVGTMTNDVSACVVNGVAANVVYELPADWYSGGGGSGGGEAGGGSGGSGGSGGGESGGGAGGGEIPAPTVRFAVGNHWTGGYGATITITNAAGVPISDWVLEYRGGPSVGSLWNGSYSASGGVATVQNAGWNSTINAGGSVSVGFNGLGTMTDDVSECRVNGLTATVIYDLPAGWTGTGSGGSGGSGGGESGGGSGGSGGSGGGESGGGSGGSGGSGGGGSSGESGPRFSCEGDLDGDFLVGDADLALAAAALGTSGANLAADLDGNGVVNELDLSILQALFGACPEKRVVAYFAEWGIYGRQYFPASMPLHKVTHVNYAFANIGADGRIALGDPYAAIDKAYPGDSWEQPVRGNYNQFNSVLKAQFPHLKTLISVGGWTWSARFSDVALTSQSRAVFAQSCVDFIRQYGFDGVDLDWEYPVSGGLSTNTYRPQDRQNYVLLLAELRSRLDAAGAADGTHYLLTIASAAGFDKLVNFDLAAMHPYLDFINVMSYDFFGAWDLSTTGHQAGFRANPAMTTVNPEIRAKYNLQWAIEHHLAQGVPASKIVPGVAFYGRSWGGVSPVNHGLFRAGTSVPPGQWDDWSSGATGVYDWTNIEDKIASGQYARHWDSTALAPWLYGSAFGGHFISYDDPQSIRLKGAWVTERGLGGLMFWESSGDRRETLFDAVLEGMRGVPGQAP